MELRTPQPSTRLLFSLSFETSGEKSLSPVRQSERVDVRLRVAQVDGVHDHANVRAVLARHLRGRDVDHLETVPVELAHEVLETGPVAVRALEYDAAAFEQPIQHELDFELAFLVLLHAEREVLEIDEYGGRELLADDWIGHGGHLER